MSDLISTSPLVLAYEAVRTEIEAVDPKTYISYPSGVFHTVSAKLKAHPKILPYKAQLATLPEFNLSLVDKLSDYGLATLHAHATHRPKRSKRTAMAELQRGIKIRDRYRGVINSLEQHGIVIDDARLTTLSMQGGYENVSSDIAILTVVIRDAWPLIQGRSPITLADLDASDQLAVYLLSIAAERDSKTDESAEPVVLRMGAYTLFANAWDEIERGLTYLLWRDSAKLEDLNILHRKSARRRQKRLVSKRAKAKAKAKADAKNAANAAKANAPVEAVKAAE